MGWASEKVTFGFQEQLSVHPQPLFSKVVEEGLSWAVLYTYCNIHVQEHKYLWKVILQVAYMALQAASILLSVF